MYIIVSYIQFYNYRIIVRKADSLSVFLCEGDALNLLFFGRSGLIRRFTLPSGQHVDNFGWGSTSCCRLLEALLLLWAAPSVAPEVVAIVAESAATHLPYTGGIAPVFPVAPASQFHPTLDALLHIVAMILMVVAILVWVMTLGP